MRVRSENTLPYEVSPKRPSIHALSARLCVLCRDPHENDILEAGDDRAVPCCTFVVHLWSPQDPSDKEKPRKIGPFGSGAFKSSHKAPSSPGHPREMPLFYRAFSRLFPLRLLIRLRSARGNAPSVGRIDARTALVSGAFSGVSAENRRPKDTPLQRKTVKFDHGPRMYRV
jgi:hypothetical protein